MGLGFEPQGWDLSLEAGTLVLRSEFEPPGGRRLEGGAGAQREANTLDPKCNKSEEMVSRDQHFICIIGGFPLHWGPSLQGVTHSYLCWIAVLSVICISLH